MKPTMILLYSELEPFNPTPQELAAAWTPNGYKFQMCITWLAEFFDLVGDHDPTSVSGEIHIEQQTKHEIWEEYVLDMKLGEELDEDVRLTGTIEQISSSYYYLNQEGEEADEYNNQQPSQSEIISSNNNIFLSYQQFCQVWKNCFDHVKIRKFKAVTGKCTACSQLTNLRCKFKSVNHRKQIHDLHQFHRITYMSERRAYYKKIWHARSQPDQFMSIILDGMAQNHTHLPWMANQSQSEGLEQHLQGLIEHGRAFTVYRTFENVVADSNLVIHVILLQIEKRLNQDKKLPPTLYLQVDGGAENANKTVLAFCELLVGRRVFKYVFLNRLMVGHTHEDIDGKYGNLWSYVRKRIMATPQDYAKAMKATYSKPDQPNFELVDLYVIPDYKAFFAASISHLMGFAKLEHTQLAWKFEHLDTVNRAEYPLNVNVMYRAFDTDVVYELIPSDKFEIGFGVARVYTKWGPTIDPMYRNTTEGMYILKELPFGQFKPAEFKPDHAAVFKAIREKIVRKLFPNCSEIKQEWEDFSRIYPQVNTSAEYVVQLGGISSLHVPLYDKLFGYLDGVVNRVSGGIIAPINSSSTQNSNIDSTAAVLQRPNNFIVNQVATHSVQWDNRGVGVEVIPPRLEVPDGIDPKDVNLDLEALRIQHLLKLATASTKEELGKWTIPTLRAICALKGIMGMSAFKIKADFVNALFQILQTEQRRGK